MENQVDSTSNRARQQQRTFEGLAGQALKLAAAYGVFTVASRAARFIFETNKEFEQLQARLESITGSTQAARSAFDLITSFAVETPFAVQELTRAFTTLQAVGIQPTTEMLRDLGNFASAMGGNIEDFVAAITKAAQGETTQLRERFLVPVRTEGDKLIVTFRGVEHQMQRSFGGVIDGFREISRQNFAGAMEKQMNTIAGSISNLKDAAALAAKEVGEQGLNRAINDFATDITEAITGSDNFARSLGSTLAAGVRLANAAFRESRELLQFLNAFATGRDLPGQTSLGGAMDRAGGFAFGGMGTGLLQLRLQERAKSTLGLDNERDLQRADQNLARWEDLARRSKDAATAAPPPPPKADTKAFDDLIQQLTAQRKELEGGARAAFEYELQLMKLTRAQRDEALVLFDSIETLKKREKTQKEAEEEARRHQAAIDSTIDQLKLENVELLQGEEALLRYSLAQHGATEADIQRAIALQRANTAQRDATEAAEDARREAEEKFKEQLKELETAADRMGSHVTDAFQAWVTGAAKAKDAFADMVTGVLREMARLALQRTVTQPLTDFFLGLIGGVLGGSTRGAGPVGTRVPDPVFGGPNAGSGGASMASRPSFSLGGARAGGGTGPVIVHQNVSFSIAALDGPSVADMLRAQKGTIAQVVGEAARESTGFRSLLARG